MQKNKWQLIEKRSSDNDFIIKDNSSFPNLLLYFQGEKN